MRPGIWDTAGFLAAGQSLRDVVEADAEELRARGTDPTLVGRQLADLLDAAGASDLGRPVRVDDLDVEIHRQRGVITCPWAPEEFTACPVGRGSFATADRFAIRHRGSGLVLQGFVLSGHLIGDHGFFGGPGTRFRLEPADLLALLRP